MSDLPKYCWDRGKKVKGTVVGSRRCQLACCRGTCVCVKWPSGRKTWPCLRGCKFLPGTKAVVIL